MQRVSASLLQGSKYTVLQETGIKINRLNLSIFMNGLRLMYIWKLCIEHICIKRVSPAFETAYPQWKCWLTSPAFILSHPLQNSKPLWREHKSIFLSKPNDTLLKVSEYPFNQNKNMSENMKVLLYIYFYNIFLNVLRPTFFNIYNLPFLRFPNISKTRVKVGPKTSYFSYILSSCTNKFAVFNNIFSLIYRQPRDKQNHARDFLLSRYFLNSLLLTVTMKNTLS